MDSNHRADERVRELAGRAGGFAVTAMACLAVATAWAQPAQKVRPPIAHYWMDAATNNMSIPGMPAQMGALGAMGGAMFGRGAGAPPGMAGPGGQGKSLDLSLTSRDKPQGPLASHATPPPSRFDSPLPLVPPEASPVGERGPRTDDGTVEHEKPRARMLIYWGCGETVRAGQPRVIDTATMSPVEFGSALAGHSAPDRGASRGPGHSLWPNATDHRPVREDASLVGAHRVTGDGVPEIAFTLGANQDFMAPIEITASGAPGASTAVEWKPVPTARAYFAQAIGSKDGAEMILWTSSETQESGFGLMDYLPNNLVDRWVGEKVLMPASATRCAIPAGIFDGVQGAMLRMIAYGQELNLVHPPRPADPKVTWEQIWAARVREKSTGMTILGMQEGRRGAAAGSAARRDPRAEGAAAGSVAVDSQGAAEQPAASPGAGKPGGLGGILPGGLNPADVLRGLFRR